MSSRYPNNWADIALAIKQRERWCCYRCGAQGLQPGKKLSSPKDRAFLIQVHHWDYDPSNNHPDNLVALCSVCHLRMHRQRHGSITIGQGILPLSIIRILPPQSAPRVTMPVQLSLWRQGVRHQQLILNLGLTA